MNFTMSRDRVVATLSGHSIAFKKGVPTHVPSEARSAVIAAGGVPDEAEPEAPKKPTGKQGAEREAAILVAMETLATKNNPKDFTAGGAPHVKVLEALAGVDLDPAERDALWAKFKLGDKE